MFYRYYIFWVFLNNALKLTIWLIDVFFFLHFSSFDSEHLTIKYMHFNILKLAGFSYLHIAINFNFIHVCLNMKIYSTHNKH